MHFLLNLTHNILSIYLERFNKKCKNLIANKHTPMVSLANALVRDGTARFFRWKRGAKPTRAPKLNVTQVNGDGKIETIPRDFHREIKRTLQCGCRLQRCVSFRHDTAKIGGRRFNVGERLRVGGRLLQ